MSWGRGGMVGVRKAFYQHAQTIRRAEVILAQEHGIWHESGARSLCPKCREYNAKLAGAPNRRSATEGER